MTGNSEGATKTIHIYEYEAEQPTGWTNNSNKRAEQGKDNQKKGPLPRVRSGPDERRQE
jgi:hypothetical protein